MLIKDATAKENIAKLPEYCFSENNVTHELIRLHAGMSGFYKATNHPRYRNNGREYPMKNTDDIADELNEALGITKGQREAMECGSMFGWEVPGANPDNYNDNGTPKR